MVNVKEWLDQKYPTENRNEITKIDSEKGEIEREELEGELVLENFPKLETVNLSEGKGITKITIISCPEIYYINVCDNLISEIKGLEELKELQWLWISDNLITDPNIIIKNERMFIFACLRNPIENKEINGRVLNKLIFFGGGIGEKEKTIFYSVEKDYVSKLKELAKKLGIKDEDLGADKKVSEIEKLVSDKAVEVKGGDEKNKVIVDKIKEKFPEGLISEGEINETKLTEIENNAKKGAELGELNLSVEDVKKMQSELKKLQRLVKLSVTRSELITNTEKPVKSA